MSEAVRYRLDDGSAVLFEVADDAYGVERVGRRVDGVFEAPSHLEEALGSIRGAALASVESLRSLRPQKLELEFGVKLTAEAGALIAKTAGEGHFVVTVTWELGDDKSG